MCTLNAQSKIILLISFSVITHIFFCITKFHKVIHKVSQRILSLCGTLCFRCVTLCNSFLYHKVTQTCLPVYVPSRIAIGRHAGGFHQILNKLACQPRLVNWQAGFHNVFSLWYVVFPLWYIV